MRMHRGIAQLHEAESDLADEYVKVADRHAVEHDVYNMCRQLAMQCLAHADALQPFAERYGTAIRDPDAPETWTTLIGMVRRKGAELMGRSERAGVLLLRDLRQLYLMACEAELGWWMVRQGAMAARDEQLAELFETCHEETWNQVKWLKTKVKEAAPQVLAG